MASVPTDRRNPREASTGELIRSLLEDVRLVAAREAELAELELKDKTARLGMAGGILAGAALIAVFALGTLTAAAVLGLAIVLPAWAAALIVGGALVIVAVILFLVGRAKMRSAGFPAPTDTIEVAKEDVAWVRRETDRLRSTG